jgi:hypothetical protein
MIAVIGVPSVKTGCTLQAGKLRSFAEQRSHKQAACQNKVDEAESRRRTNDEFFMPSGIKGYFHAIQLEMQ